ncbi:MULTISPECIES: LacI family DNA-binding transcriptional regulator [Kordiimonas]|jgi:LacI family repressor for deo operon, udp, cdd, tsx, nupC, and nupG|uniref:Transcriptional regulator, LacI family n=1 Tax=Kordiimonas lacus TaxID=637679 RepID=A0A1G6SXS7_9PROT|nr:MULTISPECIES: LacI family DNA-binding transcriptional regulator [Kordiimonas]SDD21056.1 transcriptional regulator, LacI family [Kordiimonas lacus]
MTNIREVAKKAGVSVATVSRAMQKPDVVSEKTRKKVEEAARDVGYKPNMMAQVFRSKKTYSILVLVPDMSNPFFARVISGIQKAARARGYNVVLGNTLGNIKTEQELAQLLLTSQTDGIIQLSARYPLDDRERKSGQALPIVNCCECVDDGSMPTIQLDNKEAAKAIINYLIGLGHRRIGVIAGPPQSPLTRDRMAGYREALESQGLVYDESLVVEGDYSLEAGEKGARLLLSGDQSPTALFCFNDEMAFGAMRGIKHAGYGVPADVSVAGFDDLPFSKYMEPALTSVRQPSEEFGPAAVSQLFKMIDGQEITRRNQLMPFELAIRASTGPAPKSE